MSAPAALTDLVARFAEHVDAYKNGTYNETQLRKDYLDPFFKLLGWDMDNTAGYAEAYRDVIHEDQVRVKGALKAPDYGFRIGGHRKYFMEAKKPSVKIKDDASPAYQLRRYAWSAKLPLSILSDFEEFAIYDTRHKPSPSDPASKGRIFYCRFDEYEKHWDFIAGIFSIDAIRKGSFDKYAATTKGKRGTTEVDKDFLSTIEGWRADLARNLALRNPALSQRELNFSVQRVLDRIIFLRICEDRGIEDYERLKKATDSKGIYQSLVTLFQQADDRYNSGLFHFRKEKSRHEDHDTLTPHLVIDDALLKPLIRGLYYPESPYEFSVFTADILGQVYEQFLGKVITLSAGHRASVEEKPEVKKAGGVFYTPTYIVDYIVQQTVGPLIEGKSPKQIEDIHVLDPACGSGSFLIGCYQFLLEWYLDYYTTHDPEKHSKGKSPELVAASGGGWALTTTERKRILLAHIYGVDIDSQAVEVTKLSLLLKVLEGETAQSVQRELIHERVLPDLGDNIKCGNSLIGSDFYAQPGLPEMDTDAHLRINVFDWDGKDGFPEIMKSGGFDCIVGNPPYGIPFSRPELAHLIKINSALEKYPDSYCLFITHGMNLIREGGLLSFIVPNTFCDLENCSQFRRLILENWTLGTIWQSGWAFKDAVVDTLVFVAEKKLPAADHEVAIEIDNDRYHRMGKDFLSQGLHKIDYRNKKEALELVTRLSEICEPFGRIAVVKAGVKMYEKGKGTPPQTLVTMKEKPFSRVGDCPQGWRTLYRGSDISRYTLGASKEFVNYGPWLAAPRAPELFSGIRILMRRTDDRLLSCLETGDAVCVNSCHVIKLQDSVKWVRSEFVLGILNSALLQRIFELQNPQMIGKVFAEIKVVYVERLPVYVINPENAVEVAAHDRIVSLVEKMLALHPQRAAAKTPHEQTALDRQIAATDAQIDREVYALYGLSEEEIKLVEA